MPSRDFFVGAGNLQGILLMSMIGDGKGPMDWFAERPLGIEGDAGQIS
jgi:hypothetical protein